MRVLTCVRGRRPTQILQLPLHTVAGDLFEGLDSDLGDAGVAATPDAPIVLVDYDCFGTPRGTATVDLCNVCDGTDECVDCDGISFGSSIVGMPPSNQNRAYTS